MHKQKSYALLGRGLYSHTLEFCFFQENSTVFHPSLKSVPVLSPSLSSTIKRTDALTNDMIIKECVGGRITGFLAIAGRTGIRALQPDIFPYDSQ